MATNDPSSRRPDQSGPPYSSSGPDSPPPNQPPPNQPFPPNQADPAREPFPPQPSGPVHADYPPQPGYGVPPQPGSGMPPQPGYGVAPQPGYGAPQQPYPPQPNAPQWSDYRQPSHPPAAAKPRKPPPRRIWWIATLVTMVVVPTLLIVPAANSLAQIFREDAIIPVDGNSHTVRLESEGDRMLFVRDGDSRPVCVMPGVETAPVGGTFTLNDWNAFERLVSPPSQFQILCSSAVAGTEVRVGPAGAVRIVSGVLLLVGAVLIGTAGLVWLIVLAVVRNNRLRVAGPPGWPGYS